jgi:hypothetical protein
MRVLHFKVELTGMIENHPGKSKDQRMPSEPATVRSLSLQTQMLQQTCRVTGGQICSQWR